MQDAGVEPGREAHELAQALRKRLVFGDASWRVSDAFRRTRFFSVWAWSAEISPSATARCSRSQEAICISRVVSRMLSLA